MSEIRADAREKMCRLLQNHKREHEWSGVVLDLLEIPELIVVDGKAKCPQRPRLTEAYPHYTGTKDECFSLGQITAQENMIKAGWVKEVKDA